MLARVSRIGEGEDEPADLRLHDGREDLRHRNITIVGALVIAPAGMQANTILRNAEESRVDRVDDRLGKADELAKRFTLEGRMPLQCQVWAVKLEHKAAADDRLVLH